MLPALSVSKSVSAYSPSSSSQLKMTSVVAAEIVASERKKIAVPATAPMRTVGDVMQIIPTGAGRRVKNLFCSHDTSADVPVITHKAGSFSNRRNETLSSPRAGLQPFAPKFWSAIGISARVIVKFADKCSPVCHVRRLPVSALSWLKHIIAITENLLPTDNVFELHTSCV